MIEFYVRLFLIILTYLKNLVQKGFEILSKREMINNVILFIHNFVFIRLCLEFPKLHKWSEKIACVAMGISFMNKQVTKIARRRAFP